MNPTSIPKLPSGPGTILNACDGGEERARWLQAALLWFYEMRRQYGAVFADRTFEDALTAARES